MDLANRVTALAAPWRSMSEGASIGFMWSSVGSGSGRRRQGRRLRPRATIRAGLPALLSVAGVALIVIGAPGLGWASLLFGLGLAQLLWSPKIGAPDRHDTSRRSLVDSDSVS